MESSTFFLGGGGVREDEGDRVGNCLRLGSL